MGQVLTSWHDNNDDLQQMGIATLTLPQYLGSGHLLEATFENWEREFLQMGVYVVLTIGLRQKGSPESKKLTGEEEERPRYSQRSFRLVKQLPTTAYRHWRFWLGCCACRKTPDTGRLARAPTGGRGLLLPSF